MMTNNNVAVGGGVAASPIGVNPAAAVTQQQQLQQQQQQQLQPQQQPVVQRRMRPEDAAMHITVSDPVQHADGLNKYTSYRVDVRPPSAVPGQAQPQEILPATANAAAFSAVLRRYSDFLWLYERLHAERAGAIVPPLPEKQPVGRFNQAFVEDRRVHLERFLRRVAVHPELADAAALETFLRADDATFAAAKSAKGGVSVVLSGSQAQYLLPQQQQQQLSPAGGGKKEGFKRWFAEAKTSLSGDLVKSPDDDLFEEISRYVTALDNQMRNVSHQATGLVRKNKEIANGLFEFGLAFNLLGQSEADLLGQALQKMGETADQLSVLSAEHADREMVQFEEPLSDYIKLIHAVKLALQRRHEKRLSYSTRLAEVESKRHQLTKLRSQIGTEAKAYGAEQSLHRASAAADAAAQDFAAVSQRVLREVDRFKREKAEDMRCTVLNYITLQVEYNKRMEDVWAQLIPQLERVQLDNNSSATTTTTTNTAAVMGGGGGAEAGLPQQQQQLGTTQPSPGEPVPTPAGSDPGSTISVQYRDTEPKVVRL